MSVLDRKGIFAYLLITFAITYGVEGAMVLRGIRFDHGAPGFVGLTIALVMLVPGLAAVITAKYVTREGMSGCDIRTAKQGK